MKVSGLKINFLGDSITEGAGASSFDNTYIGILNKQNIICRNYGIGGTRIARQQKPSHPQYDRDFCSRWNLMDEDADIVVVFGGTNDYGHGDAELGCNSDITPDTFYGALNYLYSNLLKKYPNSLIIVVTPPHRINEFNLRGEGNKEKDMYPLEVYVNIIREMANRYKLPLLDLYADSELEIGEEKDYFADGLHPNNAGHKLIADRLLKFIERI